MKQGKLWGETTLVHSNNSFEFHRISFKQGYKCSEHKHVHKWNGFYINSGKLIVRVWRQYGDKEVVDETILNPGDFTYVEPGKFHQFEGLEDGEAFELYWVEFNSDDIVRRSVG